MAGDPRVQPRERLFGAVAPCCRLSRTVTLYIRLREGRGASHEGKRTLSTVLAHSIELLDNPIVGVVIGLLFAAAFLFVSRVSMKMVRPGAAEAGVALAALSLFMRLALATLVLWGYKSLAPTGFKPFALAFAGGFLVLYTVELVRYAGLQKYRRPTAAVRE